MLKGWRSKDIKVNNAQYTPEKRSQGAINLANLPRYTKVPKITIKREERNIVLKT
jgi:hypothetical protein